MPNSSAQPAISADDVESLNDVLRQLHDSHKGYLHCAEMVDDDSPLCADFTARAGARLTLIDALTDKITAAGGEACEQGGVTGKLHRSFTSFLSTFRDDETLALRAIDDMEDFLGKTVTEALDTLTPETEIWDLLQQIRLSANAGENFAQSMEEQLGN